MCLLRSRQEGDDTCGADDDGALVLKAEDATAAGSSAEFLKSKLRFLTDARGQEICVVDAGGEEVGVMMGWEKDLSE